MAQEQQESNYILAMGRTPTELIEFVNTAIGHGFIPLGGVCAAHGTYIQAMIKRDVLK